MKIPDVEELPRNLVKAIEDTLEYSFGRCEVHIAHLKQQEHNLYD